MHRRFFLASPMLLLAAGLSHGAPPALAGQRAVLSVAEAPLRLIRAAAVFRAGAGVALQQDDILETAAGAAQIELGPDAIVALGPQTRVLLAGVGAVELQVLQGWVKVQVKGRRAAVVTTELQVALAGGATIVNAAPAGLDAVFAEDGDQQVARLDDKGRAGTALKLATEQYAGIEPGKPQLTLGRPPRAFVGAMPRAFRDRLVRAPAAPNAGRAAPVKERDAEFADVAAWLQATLPARRGFVARFKPRLADADFRVQIERALGQSAEWKPVLHPARPTTSNALF